MDHSDTETERLLRLSATMGAFRLADARAQGIHPETVYRLVRRGELERVGRGLYRAAEAMVTEHHGLVLATMVVPNGVGASPAHEPGPGDRRGPQFPYHSAVRRANRHVRTRVGDRLIYHLLVPMI